MATHSPSNRAALRTFVVVALSLLVLVAGGLDLRRIWFPIGEFGYRPNGDGVLTYVAHGLPAAKEGLQVGDTIDLQSTPAQFRFNASGDITLIPGQSITFGLMHGGVRRIVTLTATSQVNEQKEYLYVAYRIGVVGVALLYIALGAALVLLQPSLMTWGFFLYCLGDTPFAFATALVLFPFPWPYAFSAVFGNLFGLDGGAGAVGVVGLLVFALCFLNDPMKSWRSSALRLMPWLLVGLFGLEIFAIYQINWIGGPPGELLNRVQLATGALCSLAVLCLFVDTYVHARGEDRQRIRWIVVAFALNLVIQFLGALLVTYVPGFWLPLSHLILLSSIIVPLAVAYAVIKHRVIDVSFVVSRALVYGILTSLLVGTFAVIDWLFIDKLRLARLGTIAELGVAVAGGFWFNGLHKGIDSFIDAIFFRQRHRAELQLARDAAALPLAPTTSAVAHFLVSEPVQAMSLASAALFRRTRDGVFVREESEGWEVSDLSRLDDADGLLLTLAQSEGGPLSLYEHRWRTDGGPAGPARPVLALPIAVRRELAAIVFYGAHIHGEALDPDEIRAIAGLAPGAAAAYDHLDAEAMKREVQSVRRECESLRTQLAEAQIQPT
jgi:hypothetical protein